MQSKDTKISKEIEEYYTLNFSGYHKGCKCGMCQEIEAEMDKQELESGEE